MNHGVHPNPAQVPTLTEVIELLSPVPVADSGMNRAPRPAAPQPGQAGSVPIVTGGLAASHAAPDWTPMHTVVLPSLSPEPLPPAQMADLPVLEVVVFDPVVTPAPPIAQAPLPLADAPVPPPVPEINEAQRVLGDVQKQIDSMLDFRLREALAPILARHSDALVRDLREELSRTMRDVVARSVAQEVAKLRQR